METNDCLDFIRSALSTIRKEAYEQGLKQNHFEIDKANMKWTKETPEGVQFLKDIVKDAEEKARKYEDVFKCLLGENGYFPDLSTKPHYKFRNELRKRIESITGLTEK